MTNSNLTHIVAILDRSGSMMAIKEDMEGGFDNFIAEQAKTPGDVRVSLYQFDTEYETVYENKPLAQVPPCKLDPRGGTALLDAMGRTITSFGQRLALQDEGERPGLVVVVIITDGYENSSREWKLSEVNQLVTRQQDTYSWMFVYLGANQDAIAAARDLGISAQTAMTYSGGAGGQSAYASVGRMVTNTASNVVAGSTASEAIALADFTEEDRKEAVKTDKKKK